MIDAKDRSQLLRMAGNIACVLLMASPNASLESVADDSATLALMTMQAVDSVISEENEE